MATRRSRVGQLEARVAELEGALARAKGVNAALREVGMAIGQTLDLDDLLNLIMAKTTAVLAADRGTLYLLEDDKLVSRIMMGSEAITIEVALGQGIAGHVARTGRPLRVKDAYRDKRFDRAWDKLTGYRTRSILAVPLKDQDGKTIGVVQILNKRGVDGAPEVFTTHDTELLSALATQAAVALEKSRLFRTLFQNNEQLSETKERLERSLRDLELLYQLEAAMARADSLDELARSVVLLLAGACEAAAGALLVEKAGGDLMLYVVRADRPQEVRRVIVQPGEGIAARAMESRTVLTIDTPRAADDPTRVREMLHMPIRCALAAPLTGESQRPCGALALYNHAPKARRFSGRYGSLLELVSANVSTQLRLFRAREDRERQDRLTSIGRLLSGVMHDLRTPLTVIGGYVQLMQVTDDPAVRAEYAETVNEQFEIIATMQRDLLAYARGEKSVLLRKVYLTKFFEDMARQLEPELARRKVKLELSVQDTGTAFFDEGKIARAIHNLARNGMEAMAAHGGALTLGCRSDEESLYVTVADTGPGVPRGIRRRLFEPFVTAGKKMGTGLGLSIVKRIANEHGGDVDVQTSKAGTVFELRLPQTSAPRSRRSRSVPL